MDTPLSKLIKNQMEYLSLTKAQLVRNLGYNNTGRGINRLDNWLNGKKFPKGMEDRLSSILKVKRSDIDNAIKETKKQMKDEFDTQERKNFKPHLFAMCENSIPSPIFVGNMTYHMRFIYFDESFLELEYIDQLSESRSAIQQHFNRNNGGLPGFGRILYYVLESDYDQEARHKLIFNTDGSLSDNAHPNMNRDPGKPGRVSPKGRHLDGFFPE